MESSVSLMTVAITAAIATTVFLALSKTALWPARSQILPSPLKTVLRDGKGGELQGLVYQPDQFPGARDVDTPYGSVRVYEFGPEDGTKVIFVHGISTSCITLGRIANGLAARGYRVMLFDLFGRGFSDGVGDLPHDARLYTSQILLALASSPLSWTGNTANLHVVGYSLGGGIAVHFANAFPQMVSSLVLLAPAGLIRAESFGRVSKFAFKSGIVPERILGILTKKRLQQPIARRKATVEPVEVAAAEVADPAPGEKPTSLEKGVMLYVRWMVANHAGFVPAFMSCVRYAPLTDQEESWAKLEKRAKGSIVVLLARNDEIIDLEAYRRDALPLIGGEEKVRWRVLPGGHDFVMTYADEILRELDLAWK